ncbi:hypothetical protein MASR1M50_17690 [Burkholderiales bacterium]
MNTISNLWNGRSGLAKTYWLWGVLSGIPWGIALSLVTPGSNLAIPVVLAFFAYYVIVHVGIWRAASEYEGTKAWAILAKIGVAITPVCIVIGTLAAIIIPAMYQPSSRQGQLSTPATESWGKGDKPVSTSGDWGENDKPAHMDTEAPPSTHAENSSPSQFKKPPTLASEGWTQENTGSAESGPWLDYDPPGTRYSRMANGNIYRFFPPGVRPNAEKANPFGLDTSIDRPPR